MKPATIALIIIGAVLFLGMATFVTIIVALVSSEPTGGNVAVIPIKGIITSESSDSLFSTGGASSSSIVDLIEKADKNPRIKAIVLEINSPGGSAVASDEIGQALKNVDKPKIAWIRELGASGAYWIAVNCDVIIANRMSITGSIGVISSYLEFSGLMDDYNVTYERLVSGEYKDAGSPYRRLTDEEREILQGQLDEVHGFFIDEVAENRNLAKARELATGLTYIGADAKELGLVDILGGKDKVSLYIKDVVEIEPDYVVYSQKVGFFESLAGVMHGSAFELGRGIAFQLESDKPYYLTLNN